jgi:hypothetical protein
MTRTIRHAKRMDRHSRNGTTDDPRHFVKKQGGGRCNWGTLEDDIALAREELAREKYAASLRSGRANA